MSLPMSVPGVDYSVMLGGVVSDYPLPTYSAGQVAPASTDLMGFSRILAYTARSTGSANVPYASATYAVGTCVGTGNALISMPTLKKAVNDIFTIEQFIVVDPTNVGPDLLIYWMLFDGFLGASTVVDQAAPSLAALDKTNVSGRIAISASDYSQFGAGKMASVSPFLTIPSSANGTYCKFFVLANKTGGWITGGTGNLFMTAVSRL